MEKKLVFSSLAVGAAVVLAAICTKPNSAQPAGGQAAYVLPQSDAPIKGVIWVTYKDSKPDKIPIVDWETSISGPYDRWPALQGFDHFYGFIGGETDQWAPPLFRDTTPVEMEIPKGREGRYTLNDSLADEAIKYIHTEKSVTPDRPFFDYYATGATHAPHHVPQEWRAK